MQTFSFFSNKDFTCWVANRPSASYSHMQFSKTQKAKLLVDLEWYLICGFDIFGAFMHSLCMCSRSLYHQEITSEKNELFVLGTFQQIRSKLSRASMVSTSNLNNHFCMSHFFYSSSKITFKFRIQYQTV